MPPKAKKQKTGEKTWRKKAHARNASSVDNVMYRTKTSGFFVVFFV